MFVNVRWHCNSQLIKLLKNYLTHIEDEKKRCRRKKKAAGKKKEVHFFLLKCVSIRCKRGLLEMCDINYLQHFFHENKLKVVPETNKLHSRTNGNGLDKPKRSRSQTNFTELNCVLNH